MHAKVIGSLPIADVQILRVGKNITNSDLENLGASFYDQFKDSSINKVTYLLKRYRYFMEYREGTNDVG